MPSSSMLALLNRQVGLEIFSSNQYRQMSAWCEHKGLLNCASFLKEQAEEELDHMRKLWDFINETAGLAHMGAVETPQTEFRDIAQVLESAMAHEKKVTAAITEMVDQALTEKDYATFNFLQWYVNEQVEEETLFQTILDRMNLIGTDGQGLFFFDQEITRIRDTAGNGPAPE